MTHEYLGREKVDFFSHLKIRRLSRNKIIIHKIKSFPKSGCKKELLYYRQCEIWVWKSEFLIIETIRGGTIKTTWRRNCVKS